MQKSNGTQSDERKKEIISFYYAIFRHRIKDGLASDTARKEAYDAVSLRYEISKGRLLNIISEQKCSHSDNQKTLRQNTYTLINDLRSANSELSSLIDKNDKLIALLEEYVEDGR